MKKTLLFLLAFSLIFGIAVMFLYADDAFLPGINIEDQHPNGCVDCHVLTKDGKDYRLNADIKKIDKHPSIDKMVKKVPDDCFMCHKAGKPAGPIHLITHKQHYVNPKENVFIAHYGGACLNCHSLDTETGEIGLKSGSANW